MLRAGRGPGSSQSKRTGNRLVEEEGPVRQLLDLDGNAGPEPLTGGGKGSVQDPGIPFFSGGEHRQSKLRMPEPRKKECGGEMENQGRG